MNQTHVPVLITWDVDPDRWIAHDARQRALARAVDLCERSSVQSTFFFTASSAGDYRDQIRRVQDLGHEVGCHGLTHGDEEEYDRMPVEMQRAYIEEATRVLQDLAGMPIFSFRSPRVKTSATTLGLLAECGYVVDSSVCSQRVDFVSSNLVNLGWIRAPRRPYHPHSANAFARGDLPIWEIPVSAMVLPFISTSLRILGLSVMKAFFRALYEESMRTGKPIVYLVHPTELLPRTGTQRIRPWRFMRKRMTLTYIRTHGLPIRQLLSGMSGDACFDATQELFAYMASFPNVEFASMARYAACFLSEPASGLRTLT